MTRIAHLLQRRRRLATGASLLVLSALLVAAPIALPVLDRDAPGYAFADEGGDGGNSGGGDGNSGEGGGGDSGSDDGGSDDGGSDDGGGDDGSGDDGSEGSGGGEGGDGGEAGENGEGGDDDGAGDARGADADRRAIAGEIVVIDGPEDLETGLAALGFSVIDRRELASLGIAVTRVRLPAGLSVGEGEAQLRATFPDIVIADNTIYAPSGQIALPTPDYARTMLGWAPEALACAVGARIGLIDTRADAQAPGLRGVTISSRSFLPAGVPESPATHGTAIAEIIAGSGGGMAPLVQGPALYNAAIFERLADGTAGASAVAFAEALDWLVGEAVPLANVSLAGAPNPLLDIAIERASARGLLMVAAVGNDGPGTVAAWPAAHPSVIAVTAVGPDAALFRAAVRAPEIDFAAPGISVWSGGIDGAGRFDSGTSFAVPFVTVAAAGWIGAGGAPDPDAFRQNFASRARDLGSAGPDSEYGLGLISLAEACRGPAAD